jgi:hypothetical protein
MVLAQGALSDAQILKDYLHEHSYGTEGLNGQDQPH